MITGIAPGIGYGDPPIFIPVQQSVPGRSGDQLAPFDPTPQEVVERLLMLAGVKKGDTVYDLGSGDGRVVIAAAKKFGVKAVGFEIDPGLVKLARENVRKQGVEKLVEIRQEDFMTANLAPASVVTLYLSSDGNQALRPALMYQLKPGLVSSLMVLTWETGHLRLWKPTAIKPAIHIFFTSGKLPGLNKEAVRLPLFTFSLGGKCRVFRERQPEFLLFSKPNIKVPLRGLSRSLSRRGKTRKMSVPVRRHMKLNAGPHNPARRRREFPDSGES